MYKHFTLTLDVESIRSRCKFVLTCWTNHFRYDEETPSNSHLYLASKEENTDDISDKTEANDLEEHTEDTEKEHDEHDENKDNTKGEEDADGNNDDDFYKYELIHLLSPV